MGSYVHAQSLSHGFLRPCPITKSWVPTSIPNHWVMGSYVPCPITKKLIPMFHHAVCTINHHTRRWAPIIKTWAPQFPPWMKPNVLFIYKLRLFQHSDLFLRTSTFTCTIFFFMQVPKLLNFTMFVSSSQGFISFKVSSPKYPSDSQVLSHKNFFWSFSQKETIFLTTQPAKLDKHVWFCSPAWTHGAMS